jgi:hypothetical protein
MQKRIWEIWLYRGWGNRIEFFNWEIRQISGHIPNRRDFKIGDEVRERMETGKVARFEVIEVEYCQGVDDMFFALVKDIGYLEGGIDAEANTKTEKT